MIVLWYCYDSVSKYNSDKQNNTIYKHLKDTQPTQTRYWDCMYVLYVTDRVILNAELTEELLAFVRGNTTRWEELRSDGQVSRAVTSDLTFCCSSEFTSNIALTLRHEGQEKEESSCVMLYEWGHRSVSQINTKKKKKRLLASSTTQPLFMLSPHANRKIPSHTTESTFVLYTNQTSWTLGSSILSPGPWCSLTHGLRSPQGCSIVPRASAGGPRPHPRCPLATPDQPAWTLLEEERGERRRGKVERGEERDEERRGGGKEVERGEERRERRREDFIGPCPFRSLNVWNHQPLVSTLTFQNEGQANVAFLPTIHPGIKIYVGHLAERWGERRDMFILLTQQVVLCSCSSTRAHTHVHTHTCTHTHTHACTHTHTHTH